METNNKKYFAFTTIYVLLLVSGWSAVIGEIAKIVNGNFSNNDASDLVYCIGMMLITTTIVFLAFERLWKEWKEDKEIAKEIRRWATMRSSGMTHSEFEKWLNDTCADAPNHTIKYSGCSGTRNGNWLDYRFEFKRGEWIYGYNGEAEVNFYNPPLKHSKDTYLSKRLRNNELLKENFFSIFKDGLASKLSSAKADPYDWFREIGPCRCKNRFLSTSEKQKICDDAEHFHQEVVEDLEYLNAQFSNLCECLFGSCDEQES